MTSPTGYMVDQINALHQRISNLESQRVTYVQAAVSTINVGASTFAANIPQADGSVLNIAGINSPPNFLPSPGNTVTLALSGAQLVYQPYGIAPGAVDTSQLSTTVSGSITTAQTSANVALTTGPNLVPDPGFENGFRTVSAPWSIDTAVGNAHAGTKSLKVTGHGGTSSETLTQQEIPVLAGHVFRVSGWRKTDASYNGTSASQLQVLDQNGLTVASNALGSGTTYAQISFNYTVPSSGVAAVQVQITADNAAGNLWVDDVELSDITDANAAQSTANTAQSTATTAQSTATTANTTANTANTTANTANTAAGTAQGTANVAMTIGPNLVPDPSFENGFLTLTSPFSFDTGGTNANSGTDALKCTSHSGTATVTLTPQKIPVLQGHIYRLSGWYKTDASWNGTSTNSKLKLINQAGAVVLSFTLTNDTTYGPQLSSNYTVPSDGTVTFVQVQVSSDNAAGNLWVDDVELADITDANAAQTTANGAQSTANTANTAAGNAQTTANTANTAAGNAQTTANTANSTANTALTTANGKNTVTWSASAASGSGTTTGDIWFQQTSGVIVGSWQWSGSAWVARTFGDAVLNSLTAGKITTGTLSAALTLSGSIKTATTGQRVEIDSNGVRLFNSGGGTVVNLDASTGTGTFSGTVDSALIRTSSSGQRLEVTGGSNNLNFHPSGAGSVATINSVTDANGHAGVTSTAGGTTHGFQNMTSILSDHGFVHTGGASSFFHIDDSKVNIGVASGVPLSMTTDQPISLFEGANVFGKFTPSTTHGGLSKIVGFAIDGADVTNFTFGTGAPYTNDADVYAGRFISTQASGTGGFIYFSDQRMKKNIQLANMSALPLILGTPVRQFQWANTGASDMGWIAQEVPDLALMSTSPGSPVNGLASSATPVGISLDKMVLLLWKAMQELLPLLPGGGGRPLPAPSYSRADVATITDSVTAVLTPGV